MRQASLVNSLVDKTRVELVEHADGVLGLLATSKKTVRAAPPLCTWIVPIVLPFFCVAQGNMHYKQIQIRPILVKKWLQHRWNISAINICLVGTVVVIFDAWVDGCVAR